jgi:Zinc finger, C2H2 type
MNLSQVNMSNPNDDKKEFDELYQLLVNLSKKKFNSNESKINEPSTATDSSAIIDLFKTKKYVCKACDKGFITDSLLTEHIDRSKSCKKWLELSTDEQQIILQKPIHLFIDECITQSFLANSSTSTTKFECKFCNSSFVNKGNLNKHFSTSIACNRLCYHEFKKQFLSI